MGSLLSRIPAPALFNACGAGDAEAVSRLLPAGRGLYSFTFQLNLTRV